jgi:ribosomal protection tetracycline resistance protein
MRILNLGILAHVDAGKTTLTERLLYAAGVIETIGSVDAGSTQTDYLQLERQRGITIKSAVASFVVGDVTVNLIDTPGHPDFIAEVERVLCVLDGVVLVVSAVEGVQPQTRILMRALQRLRLPTIVFVNKIDRPGASQERTLAAIRERLSPSILALGRTEALGSREARYVPFESTDDAFVSNLLDLAADNDESLLQSYVGNTDISFRTLHDTFAALTRTAVVHPVFFGSALTGSGVDALTSGIVELLPTGNGDASGDLRGTVFKVDRGPQGERIALVRLFSGRMTVRDRIVVGAEKAGKITALRVFDQGATVQTDEVSAGRIAKVWGLEQVRVGDDVGRLNSSIAHHFPPPPLEAEVVPCRPDDKGPLHQALRQLAEQDPLINLRQDESGHAMIVSVYGEVQKEVIQATLSMEFGIEAEFRETRPIYIERPSGRGEAVELLGKNGNPFPATIGLRVEPGPVSSGLAIRFAVEVTSIPLYVYKSVGEFRAAMEVNIRTVLQEGLFGWEVTDCVVTMFESGYAAPSTTSQSFRLLTPLVLMSALREAGTIVCEPLNRIDVELPQESVAAAVSILARLGGALDSSSVNGSTCVLTGTIAAGRLDELRRILPGVSGGEGIADSSPGPYRPLSGPAPSRRRTDLNPLNRKEYLSRLAGRF